MTPIVDPSPAQLRALMMALRFAWVIFCVAGSIVVFNKICDALSRKRDKHD